MRHERAIIVTLAYVIGFTSAFIAYGVQPVTDLQPTNKDVQNAAGIVTAVPERLITQDDVVLDSRGLFVIRDGEEYPVSAQLRADVEAGPGYHVSIDSISLVNNGRFLYYCAQETFEEIGCTSYVYDVAKHSVRTY